MKIERMAPQPPEEQPYEVKQRFESVDVKNGLLITYEPGDSIMLDRAGYYAHLGAGLVR